MKTCDNPTCENEILPSGTWLWCTDKKPWRLYCSIDCFEKGEMHKPETVENPDEGP